MPILHFLVDAFYAFSAQNHCHVDTSIITLYYSFFYVHFRFGKEHYPIYLYFLIGSDDYMCVS